MHTHCLFVLLLCSARTSVSDPARVFWDSPEPILIPTFLDSTNLTWDGLERDWQSPDPVQAKQSSQPLFIFDAGATHLMPPFTSPVAAPPVAIHPVPMPELLRQLRSGNLSGEERYMYYSALIARVSRGGMVMPGTLQSSLGQALAAQAVTLAQAGSAAISPIITVTLWLASPGACASLHYDAAVNMYTQVLGSKTLVVYPPEAAAHAGLFPGHSFLRRQARAGLDGRAAAGAPLASMEPRTYHLHPGQTLLIPPFWMHHVCASSARRASLSVSFWAPGTLDVALPSLPLFLRTSPALPLALLPLMSTPPAPASANSSSSSSSSSSSAALLAASALSLLRARYVDLLQPAQGSPEHQRGASSSGLCAGAGLKPVHLDSVLAMWLRRVQGMVQAHASVAARAMLLADWAEGELLQALHPASVSAMQQCLVGVLEA